MSRAQQIEAQLLWIDIDLVKGSEIESSSSPTLANASWYVITGSARVFPPEGSLFCVCSCRSRMQLLIASAVSVYSQ